MTDITDKNRKPDLEELFDYTGDTLIRELCGLIEARYGARYEIVYSGDSNFSGWNIRLFKSRTLLRLYPRRGMFFVLLVIGKKEKAGAEQLLPSLSDEMRRIYEGTVEGMGQRWLMIPIYGKDAVYTDLLKLTELRA